MVQVPHCADANLPAELVAETAGINLYSEYSLHDALKRLAAGPDGRIEAKVEGKVADALTASGEIIEIQTARLGSIQDKIDFWISKGYRVRVQYPLASYSTIMRISQTTGELLSSRASPRHRSFLDAFDELVRAPGMISTPGLTFEILLVRMREVRIQLETPQRRGRFLRATRTEDRSLEEVLESRRFSSPRDWLSLLVPDMKRPPWREGEILAKLKLPSPLSSATLAESLGIRPAQARKILYCLARAGFLRLAGTEGNAKLYGVSPGIGDFS